MFLCGWVDGWIYVHKEPFVEHFLQLWIVYRSMISVIGMEIVKLRYSSVH